jgi:nucleoid DNA-binding protein
MAGSWWQRSERAGRNPATGRNSIISTEKLMGVKRPEGKGIFGSS